MTGVADFIVQIDALKQFTITRGPAEPPRVGRGALANTLGGRIAGQPMTGDLVVWRHGGVIAAVLTLSTGTPGAPAHVAKQEAKLTAVFGAGD